MSLEIIQTPMPNTQYYIEVATKKQIVIHHTAGGHRADRQAGYWAGDDLGRVGTAFIIGGKSTRDGDTSFDGKIYQAFDSKYWAHHLGLKSPANTVLNKQSIGIEVCNYGFAKKVNGEFLSYVNSVIPTSDIIELAAEWKGYKFWHKYTDAQLKSLKELILKLANEYNINVKKQWNLNSFDISKEALRGDPGLFTHVNYRLDKFDMHPQKELIDMLNSL